MTPIFVDTSYLIALETADDQYHETVLWHWRHFNTSLPPLVTTSYVFDEVVTFFNRRNRHAKAVEVGSRLLSSSMVEFVHVDQAVFYEAWQYFA